ncbi:PHD and RING finger domain-containing protein 1 [Paragonimus westermani]|uniref:PHD and RING finger domain-containing protein 1 n=1 Tax=Paragonimus westermani TaxID=34504 RepID=A0A5J4NEM9_9TREM|nr:PHD and RING finger domain-containing protein 1 [Paragonimus westermani]
MLDLTDYQKDDQTCRLCNGLILHDNCSPKGCSHVFHPTCFENWTTCNGLAEEYTCPASNCTSIFHEIVIRKAPLGPPVKVVSLKESHQCPICCEPLKAPIATPESCNHMFCYVCLREWSRVRHECPLDRGAFDLILLSDKIGGPITKRVSPPPVELQPLDEQFDGIDINCEICSLPDDEAHLLLCDHCDRGFHTYCLPDPLSSVPSGDWFCPDCVRHGIRSSNVDSIGVDTVARRRQRSRLELDLVESEAEESDHQDSHSSHATTDEDNFSGHRRLTGVAQRLLRERANRRYRGSRLLQETILDLAQRALSEVSSRARQRRIQRQRVRTQLSAELLTDRSRPTQTMASQQTLCFQVSSEPECPAQLRLASPNHYAAVNNSSEAHPTTGSTSTLPAPRTQARRKRLLVLSDSGSESEADVGVSDPFPSSRRDRMRHIRSPSDSENQEPDDRSVKRARPGPLDESTEIAVSDTGTGSTSVVIHPSTSNGRPLDSTLSTPSERTSSTKSSTRLHHKRKVIRKKHSSTKAGGKKGRKFVRKSRIPKKLTATQKKLKKRAQRNSTNSSSTTSANSSFHRSPNKKPAFTYAVPRLSLFGSEPTCRPQPSTSSSTETFRSTKPNLLSEIEAKQASTFKFTTRHMQVNADNSMSPIPVSLTSTGSGTNVLKSTGSPSVKITLPLKPPALATPLSQVASTSASAPNHTNVLKSSRSQMRADQTGGCSVSLGKNTGLPAKMLNGGWSADRLANVKSLLKANLKPKLANGLIDKSTYRHIIERALFKVQQKDVSKVSDSRVIKLANEYVDYHLKHSYTNSS